MLTRSIPQASRSVQHKSSDLDMVVETIYGKRLPPGVSLKLGDKIRLRMTLKSDGKNTFKLESVRNNLALDLQ